MTIATISANPLVVKKTSYAKPVNRKTERNLAILGSAGWSAIAGVTAGGLTSCITPNRKISTVVGIGAALVTLLLILPPKLFNTKKGALSREKEMDVSQDKKLSKQISTQI